MTLAENMSITLNISNSVLIIDIFYAEPYTTREKNECILIIIILNNPTVLYHHRHKLNKKKKINRK